MQCGTAGTRRLVAVLGATLVSAIVAGCGVTAPAGTVAQPGFDSGDAAMTASIDGILAGDADMDGGCVWLEGADGETIDRCMVSDDLVQTWNVHVEGAE